MATVQPQYKQYLPITGRTWQEGTSTWRPTEGHWVDTIAITTTIYAVVIETAGGVVRVPIDQLKVGV